MTFLGSKMPFLGVPLGTTLMGFLGHLFASLNKDLVLREGPSALAGVYCHGEVLMFCAIEADPPSLVSYLSMTVFNEDNTETRSSQELCISTLALRWLGFLKRHF